MKRRVIITGGTGFIGRHLCQALLDKEYEVIILSRNPEKTTDNPNSAMKIVQWDSRSDEGWRPEADGAYAVVNLAGENIGAGRWTAERKERILQSRINAGTAVVKAIEAAENRPEILIQASGIGIYGDQGDQICDETTASGKGFMPEVAVEWEASTQQVEALGTRRAVIRTGVVLGNGDGFLPRVLLPFRLFAGGHFGNGRQWLSWIHIQDQINAIIHLMENETARGIFNLCAPNPVTSKTFSKTLGRVMKRPSWLPVPGFALKMMLGEMARELILSGQRAKPTCLLESGFSFSYCDLEAALQELMP